MSAGPGGLGPAGGEAGPDSALSSCRLVREFVAQNSAAQIKHVIQTLSVEFALSQHPHSRKGGLIGLAACSIALGKVGAAGPEAGGRAGGPGIGARHPAVLGLRGLWKPGREAGGG